MMSFVVGFMAGGALFVSLVLLVWANCAVALKWPQRIKPFTSISVLLFLGTWAYVIGYLNQRF